MSHARAWIILLAAAGVLSLGQPADAQAIDEAFRADIERLMEVTGSAALGAQAASLVSGQILQGLKASHPDIPDRAIAVVREVLDAEFAGAFKGPGGVNLVAIYAKHFTREDVQGLLAFYRSDLGRKILGELPQVFQESAAAGQTWAAENMPRIAGILEARLKAEGFVK